MTTASSKTSGSDRRIPRLHATTPEPLPFAPESLIRAFLLEREQGNLLVYNTGSLERDLDQIGAHGGAERQYLNHWHEVLFGLPPEELGARLLHHEADAAQIAKRGGEGEIFSERHRLGGDFEVIPIPGHTPGATAYLWDTGDHRLLFTGDSIYLSDGEWRAAVLEDSDRDSYISSLELVRELDFDVLVPWAASAGGPYLAFVDEAERRERIDAIVDRVRRGESR